MTDRTEAVRAAPGRTMQEKLEIVRRQIAAREADLDVFRARRLALLCEALELDWGPTELGRILGMSARRINQLRHTEGTVRT